jgi:hypothetical protein
MTRRAHAITASYLRLMRCSKLKYLLTEILLTRRYKAPTSIRSCTGYVICIVKYPIMWVSQLQTRTTCSMMHAKYIALATTVVGDLLPFMQIADGLCHHMGLLKDKLAIIKTKTVVHKDNSGTLTLAKLEPGCSTLTSKFFNGKHHWF